MKVYGRRKVLQEKKVVILTPEKLLAEKKLKIEEYTISTDLKGG